MPKILRITTVPISLNILLKGQLKFMKSMGFTVASASADGQEVEQFKQREGVPHYKIAFTRTMSPFKDFIALLQTIMLIRKLRPDIVHTHTPKAGLIGMLAAWMCGVPIRAHTVAGLPLIETQGVIRKILTWTEKITYYCATNIYPNSFELSHWISKNIRIESSKLKVLGHGSSNGIDTKFFKHSDSIVNQAAQLRKDFSISNEACVFVFVGRLVRDKGINELITAFTELKRHNKKECFLMLVGNYEDHREPVSQEIKDIIDHDNQILQVGFQTDIRPYLAMSDVFVFPSYREGFPNVVMQAACFNLPCIVTDINGCNELIQPDHNGILVKLKDTDQLMEAMERLLLDTFLIKNMSAVARKAIVDKYDQKLVWDAILKEYKRLLILHGVQTDN